MFLSLKANRDKVADLLGMTASIGAAVGLVGIAAAFAPVSIFTATATLVSAVVATELGNRR
jgi:hypothetical protein